MDTDAQLAQYFAGMWPHLDEHARRLVAASQAVELGYGGISRVSRACGLSRVTLAKGVEELQAAPLASGRIRHEGGGRHTLTSNDPGLAPALEGMVEPTTRGDPQSPLRWTCKSARTLAVELTARYHPVSHTKVTQLLREAGYSLQGNRKTARRAVPAYQPSCQTSFAGGRARHFRGHEEEGIGRQLPEPGPPVARNGDGGQGQRT